MTSEKDLQNACMEYMDTLGIKYYHRYNYTSQKNRKSVHKKFKGYPDFTIPLSETTIYVELKFGNNGLTDEQKEWELYFKETQNPFYVVRGLEEFQEIIERWK